MSYDTIDRAVEQLFDWQVDGLRSDPAVDDQCCPSLLITDGLLELIDLLFILHLHDSLVSHLLLALPSIVQGLYWLFKAEQKKPVHSDSRSSIDGDTVSINYLESLLHI